MRWVHNLCPPIFSSIVEIHFKRTDQVSVYVKLLSHRLCSLVCVKLMSFGAVYALPLKWGVLASVRRRKLAKAELWFWPLCFPSVYEPEGHCIPS